MPSPPPQPLPIKRWHQPKLPDPPKLPTTTIQQDFVRKSNHGASGLGRHLINDFFFRTLIFPGTPSYVVCCTQPALYERIREQLPLFMARFGTPEFFEAVGSIPNSANPFAFNQKSNSTYMGRYIDVFRRVKVKLTREFYNAYARAGLLDKNHIIGK